MAYIKAWNAVWWWLLLFFSVSPVTSTLPPPRQYSQHRLDKLCGRKINLGKKPGVFLLSGPPDNHLECEVEIRSASPAYGLYVFIEELKLDKTPNCSADFLQFGR